MDWLNELQRIDWAVASLVFLHEPGSYEKELTENAVRGIKSRLAWITEQAKAERAEAERKAALAKRPA